MKDRILEILEGLENVDKVAAVVFSGEEGIIVPEKSRKKFKNKEEIVVLGMRADAMMKSAIVDAPVSINVFSENKMGIIRSTKNGQLIILAEEWANINLLDLEVTRAAKKITEIII